MLRDYILNTLDDALDALEYTCSGLRDPNRLRVAAGRAVRAHLAETLPPDPVEEAVEVVKPEPVKKTTRKKKEQ